MIPWLCAFWQTIRGRVGARCAVCLLLVVHAAMLAWGAAVHSPTTDEPGQLVAGLSHWEFGRFELYRVTPPLVRMVGALPVLAARPATDWSRFHDYPGSRAEVKLGIDFCTANGPRLFWLTTLARWACIPFSLLGGSICYLWAKKLYGPVAGLLALTLWCFSPNVLAHAQLITTDVAGAALCVTACFAFWHWLKHPEWGFALVAGLLLGLTELSKGTFVVLYGVWPALWLVWRWKSTVGPAARSWGRQTLQMSVILTLGLYLLNLGYGFEGSLRPLRSYRFVSESLAGPGKHARVGGNRFADSWLGAVPVPLPENYLRGLDTQRRYFERRLRSYLRGEWKRGGWWYYYLYGLAVKVPLGTWVLFVMVIGVSVWGAVTRRLAHDGTTRGGTAPPVISLCQGEIEMAAGLSVVPSGGGMATDSVPPGERTASGVRDAVGWWDELVLLAPAVVILALVSSQTGFNKNLRYVLPVFPFVFVWVSRIADPATLKCRAIAVLGAVAVIFSIGSSLHVYPHSLSYFNGIVGGPTRGHEHLLHTNIDFGQDLLFLKSWLDDHQGDRPLGLAYYDTVDPTSAGIQYRLPPFGPTEPADASATNLVELGPHPGLFAVSVNFLRGHQFPAPNGEGTRKFLSRHYYGYFLEFEPIAMAGYSIYIYDISLAQANAVRRKLRLPLLQDREEKASLP